MATLTPRMFWGASLTLEPSPESSWPPFAQIDVGDCKVADGGQAAFFHDGADNAYYLKNCSTCCCCPDSLFSSCGENNLLADFSVARWRVFVYLFLFFFRTVSWKEPTWNMKIMVKKRRKSCQKASAAYLSWSCFDRTFPGQNMCRRIIRPFLASRWKILRSFTSRYRSSFV